MKNDSASGLADTVAAHLEQVTRFDRSDLTQEAPDRPIAVELTLALDQAVSYQIIEGVGPGPLPLAVRNCGSDPHYLASIRGCLQKANNECGKAMRAFVAAAPTGYRRIMPPAAAFLAAPGHFGFEFSCRACSGARRVRCTGCSGGGQVQCGTCTGQGTIACVRCSGTGAYSDGAGERRRCYNCSGGRCQCGSCSASGEVTCGPCGGCGRVKCGRCAATGIEHQSGTVSATVNATDTLAFAAVDQTLEAIIRTRIATGDLCSFGQFRQVEHHYGVAGMSSVHQLRIDAVFARLHAAKQRFGVYGLGPRGQVLDFVNIAGHLLEDDLAELEQAKGAALAGALRRSVASELNLLIAEQVIDTKLSAQEAAAAVENQFHSMVDAAYVARATTALRSGFGKLYSASLVPGALWLVAATTLFSLLLYTFGPPRLGIRHITGWATVGALLWFGIEWAMQWRIRRSFPARLSARLKTLIRRSSKMTPWRLGVTSAIAACAFGSMTLAARVPPIQQKHLNQTIHERSWDPVKRKDKKETFISHSMAVYNDRGDDATEGRHAIQEAARAFISADNRKREVDYVAMISNEQAIYPKCTEALTVKRAPFVNIHAIGGLLVQCSKSVSKEQRTWSAFVPVLPDTTLARPRML